MRSVSAQPGEVPYEVALAAADDAIASAHFREHFNATRVLRFEGGQNIPRTVPIRVVWGDSDKVALKSRSRYADQLPPHTIIDTWKQSGHMIMWDRKDDTIAAALATSAHRT